MFNSLFLLSRLSLRDKNLCVPYLAAELARTRFHFASLPNSYRTYATINGVSLANIDTSWKVVGQSIENIRNADPDYSLIEADLVRLGIDGLQISKILVALKQLISQSRKSLLANVNPDSLRFEIKLGTIGELVAFLYSRDFQRADCVYHKLVFDNPNVARHGMDLLTICFEDQRDVVRFWEAKATISDFANQCRRIVEWFSGADAYDRISLVIEAAKIDWEKKFESHTFNRASTALSKFQANIQNFKYSGSVIYDSSSPPTESNIQIFDDIEAAPDNKHLVIFEAENLKDIVEEVYRSTCKM